MLVNKYWFSFFIIKIFYMFFAVFIYSKFTTLGDSGSYIIGQKLNWDNFYYNSTSMMSFLGLIFSSILGNILVHLPFVLISFYGIYYSVEKLKLSNNHLFYVLLLLSFPSFGIWTSIISKEAIGVFCLGIILGYFIDLFENSKRKIKIIEYFAFYLLFIFKIQYFAAILSIWIFVKLSNLFKLKSKGKAFLLFLHCLITILLLYYFKDFINQLSFIMPNHFDLEAGSTRENTIWINDYDVFYNAPYGMFIAFWGPTILEIVEKPIQSLVFIESLVILLFFLYFIYKVSILIIRTGKVNVFYFTIFFMVLFWLLFVHYPFGVLNPGSAIRYRENFYGFIVVLLFYLYQKIKLRYQIEKNSLSY